MPNECILILPLNEGNFVRTVCLKVIVLSYILISFHFYIHFDMLKHDEMFHYSFLCKHGKLCNMPKSVLLYYYFAF